MSFGYVNRGKIMKIMAQSASHAKANCTKWFRFGDDAQWQKKEEEEEE